ncbi:hypothetical protein [Staphylococcus aureus]|uniref:hypothetical protein n=1 Tax=Staphylococcus aureus TaxID=1280 RepID=UPI00315CDB99
MRHDIYEGVLFYIMKGIKPNYAELGRQYNCDPRTVKKYYEAGKENELERLKKRQQNKKASKLDPFKEIINKKIELGCTAMAIFKYKSSPDSCVKCYTMFLPFLLIKIDVFS